MMHGTINGVDWMSRARAYAAKIPPAVHGSDGSGALMAALRNIYNRFPLDADDFRVIADEYSETCQPPWSDRELDHKIADVRKNPSKQLWLAEQNGHASKPPNAHKPTSKPARTFATAQEAIADLERQLRCKATIWPYHDPLEMVCGYACRLDLSDGKTFRPVSLFHDGWQQKAMPTPRPLYLRAELVRSQGEVHVSEGEKCVDALVALGFTATTHSGGADAVKYTDWTPLKDSRVCIWADNDDKGKKCANEIAQILLSLGCSVRIVYLDFLPPGGDAYDLIARRREDDAKDDAEIRAELIALANQATPVSPVTPKPPPPIGEPSQNGKSTLVLTNLSGVTPKPIKFLIPGYLPLGKVTLKAGDGGGGKSATSLDTAARLSTGRPCYGLDYEAPPPCDVMLVTIEDGVEDTIVPRLLAAGADLSRIHHVSGVQGPNGSVIPFNLDYFHQVELALLENRNIRYVCIDPAGGFISGRINDHKDAELRQLLQPLATVADKLDVAIELVKHLNKNAGVKAIHRISGSVAWVNTVRLAYFVGSDDEDEDLKVQIPVKGNLTKKAAGLKYRIVGLDIAEAQGLLASKFPGLPPADAELLAKQMHRIQWEGTTDKNADELSNPGKDRKTPKANNTENAKEWLRKACAEYAYPCTELEAMAAQDGLTSGKYLHAARMELKTEGFFNQKIGFGPDSVWWFGKGRRHEWTHRPEAEAVF